MIHHILRHLVPDCLFVNRGEPTNEQEYAKNVDWHDKRPQPTWAEIEAARTATANAIANEEIKRIRATAYREEADPLFFGWQRGENTEQDWLNKVAEIRARYPYIA